MLTICTNVTFSSLISYSKVHCDLITVIDKWTLYINLGLKFDAGEKLGFYVIAKGEIYMSEYSGSISNEIVIQPHVKTESNTTNGKKSAIGKSKVETNNVLSSTKQSPNANGESFEKNDEVHASTGDEVSIYFKCSSHPTDDILICKMFGDPNLFILGDPNVCHGMIDAIIGMEVGQTKHITCAPDVPSSHQMQR